MLWRTELLGGNFWFCSKVPLRWPAKVFWQMDRQRDNGVMWWGMHDSQSCITSSQSCKNSGAIYGTVRSQKRERKTWYTRMPLNSRIFMWNSASCSDHHPWVLRESRWTPHCKAETSISVLMGRGSENGTLLHSCSGSVHQFEEERTSTGTVTS